LDEFLNYVAGKLEYIKGRILTGSGVELFVGVKEFTESIGALEKENAREREKEKARRRRRLPGLMSPFCSKPRIFVRSCLTVGRDHAAGQQMLDVAWLYAVIRGAHNYVRCV